MAEAVKFDIVLTDDGEPAQRPNVGSSSSADPSGSDSNFTMAVKEELEKRKEAAEQAKVREAADAEESKTWLGRLKQAGDLLEGGAKRFERIMVPLASNDFLGSFRSAADAASEGLEKLGPYGKAAGAALQSVIGVVESFASVVTSFIERGKQLAQYSPELAMSGARAEITSMYADMREAQELGPGIARMQDAQTELVTMLRDALLPLKKWVVENLAALLETLIQWAKDGYIAAGDIKDILLALPVLIHDKFMLLSNQTAATLADLENKRRDRRKDVGAAPKPDPFDDAMAEMLKGIIARGGVMPDPIPGGG